MAHAIPRKHDIESLVITVRQEFEEMPGLTLTVDQAQRLWALEPRMCGAVLERLVKAGYLCQTASGHYVKPSAA
ncbi:MAG: hypothetical protein KA371_16155 [Acidobacteria bacterium]|mgnify:CR=1 FL=1|nr:hypothetical protein [Acidobacteriota bacterium]